MSNKVAPTPKAGGPGAQGGKPPLALSRRTSISRMTVGGVRSMLSLKKSEDDDSHDMSDAGAAGHDKQTRGGCGISWKKRNRKKAKCVEQPR